VLGGVGARRTADLAELKDWVEGLRGAAHTARNARNVTLAKALDITRFEVYESYLDEEYTNKQSQAVDDQKLGIDETVGVGRRRRLVGWLEGGVAVRRR
jgi:hypothetical protein